MAINKIPTSIDYTSRDFYSLRDDLISRVQTSVSLSGKQWAATDQSDFGLALVEAFAHVGDVANYYIDRVANEAYLSTAISRQSILNLAAMYGYKPMGYRQSFVTLTFNNPTDTDIKIPAGTVYLTSIALNIQQNSRLVEEQFTVLEETLVLANSSGTATAMHGRFASSLEENYADPTDIYDVAGELLGYSTGYANQQYTLKIPQVVDNTVKVFIKTGNQYVQWNEVPNLAEHDATEHVYQLFTDENNYVTVVFGDGVSGAMPTYGDVIKADYIIGGGVEGNIEGGNSFHAVYVPSNSGFTLADIAPITTVNSSGDPATGGSDPESNESIRKNAALALSASSRAVSLQDFKSLASSIAGVGKSSSYATDPSSVAVYIAPYSSENSADPYPGYYPDNVTLTSSWTNLQSTVRAYFNNRIAIGTTVNVLPPTYVPATLDVEFVKEDGYTEQNIIDALKYQIIYTQGYYARDFDEIIRPEKLEKSLTGTTGVDTIKIIAMSRPGGSGVETLIAGEGELFTFVSENVNVYPVASLKSLVLSEGALPFSPGVFSYTTSVDGATSSITVTPTVARQLAGSASTVKVNGVDVTSGSASGSISLTTGVNVISVEVFSYDGVHTQTYTISVTKP